jgi:hypothetical protein
MGMSSGGQGRWLTWWLEQSGRWSVSFRRRRLSAPCRRTSAMWQMSPGAERSSQWRILTTHWNPVAAHAPRTSAGGGRERECE